MAGSTDTMIRVPVRVIWIGMLAGVVWGCGREPSHPVSYPGASVVLISIDTLRADRLPVYGYAEGSTPRLNQLAQSAIVFDDVYSHIPLTLPSHASLLTGLLPFRHGVRDNVGYSMRPTEATLATRFKAAGYATGAAVSSFVLRHQTGIAAGFDFFDDRIETTGTGEALSESQRDGRLTVDALAGWVDGQPAGAPLFVWLHLYEPHAPYTPPASHHMADPYDGEIAYADELVGRFLDRLNARGVLQKAVVAVVSDHGEGLGDHGEAEHGIFLYREALRVPWILRLPDGGRRGHATGTLGLVDVTATLLDLAGLAVNGLDGQSVSPALSSEHLPDRSVYSETMYPRLHFGWSDLASVTEGRYRFIRAPHSELFDLASDPREHENLIEAKAATAKALRAWVDRASHGASMTQPSAESTEVRERLKALGYVSSSPPTAATASGALPDPKDHIRSYEALKEANALERAGKRGEAIDALRRLVAENPLMLDGWESLAKALARSDRLNEAIEAFGKVLSLDPLKPETHLALARIYGLTRQATRARQHAELAATRDPAGANEILAELMLDENKSAEAEAYARKSIDADSGRYMSHFVLGVVSKQQGSCDAAVVEFQKAIEAKRLEPNSVVRGLHAGLAECLARAGREAEAEREFQTEIETIPWSPEGRVGLAMLYRSQGRDRDARVTLEGLIANTPQASAEVYWTVVRSFTVLGDASAAREWAAKARQKFPTDPRFR